ncbi:hypothetical protein [Pseudomonas cannabina]|uniref:Putative prophage PSSB64-02, Orf37 n=1 Tax=Pseudomonas cannabina TaxID=86840 RepID=A0A0P9LKS9_PSECA|nr:hypothetical protein [Pseudomonas cannabina]KAA8712928.1 hypothetical protein F4W70_10015 [Pseudomonas cannabina]KPW78604.1 putative prophage PSSB64-02, Orf37 [Pseudomonas cannabina]RMN20775.1 putative prophage PSSB64-02, Orf37 [Pseudomonas cannabina]SDR04840.1 hypothetical protein SAMN05216597_2104 [Pseudomonas cannabina]
MTVDIEKLEALAKAAKSGGAEWSDLNIDTERMYTAEGMLVELYEFATPAVLLELCSDNEALRGLYQMHKQTEAREMRDLKAENAGLKTGYEAYERVNAELRAECDQLKRNRDMWKGQVERQSEMLRLAHEADKQLKAECEALRKDASLHTNLQRAAGELPDSWSIDVSVERHAGWVSLLDGDGCEHELSGEGHLGEQVSEALEVALEMSKEATQ